MVRICALMLLLLLPIGCVDSASAPTANEPGKVESPDQLATGNAASDTIVTSEIESAAGKTTGDTVAASKTLLISVPGMT